MATPGKSGLHGVIHEVTPVDMEKLDAIHTNHDRVEAAARLYDGSEQTVIIHVQKQDTEKDQGKDEISPRAFRPRFDLSTSSLRPLSSHSASCAEGRLLFSLFGGPYFVSLA